MSTLVLMGAGASFGSESGPPRPPLGKDLFDELDKQGGVAANLPEQLKDEFRTDFEAGMLSYFEQVEGNVMQFQRELAHYLASFSPSEKSVYLNLIRTLGTKTVIYCSLNYALLFELSATKLGYDINYSASRRGRQACIIKPHGSSNFWPNSTIRLKGTTLYNYAGAALQTPIRALNQTETLRSCNSEDSISPAMSMYAAGKRAPISPDYIRRQQAFWKDAMAQATRIFIVGTRVHYQVDKHIWEPLNSCVGKITYFGFDTDRPEFDAWLAASPGLDATFVNADFAQSVTKMKRLMRG